MMQTLREIHADSRIYREWFDFVGNALVTQGKPLSLRDMTTIFCEAGEPLDGRPATSRDYVGVAAALTRSLQGFESCRLISSEMEARYTRNVQLYNPERVAQLTDKGREMLRLPAWRVEFMFLRFMLAVFGRQLWKPFAGAVAAAGTISTVLKIFLLWKSEQAVVAGALVGVAAFVGHVLQGRR